MADDKTIIFTSLALAIITACYTAPYTSLAAENYNLALITYAIINLTNIIGGLSVPLMINLFGVKNSLLIGTCSYPIFILARYTNSMWFLIIASAYNGWGSAITRAVINIWTTHCGPSVTKQVSIFNMIYYSNILLGFILMNIEFWLEIEKIKWYIFLSLVSIIYYFSLACIPDVEIEKDNSTCNCRFLIWIPVIILQSCGMSFTYFIIPSLITNKLIYGMFYLIYGFTMMITYYIFRYINHQTILTSSLLLFISNLILVALNYHHEWYIYLFFISFNQGIIDAGINYFLVCELRKYDNVNIYGYYRTLYCLFMIVIILSIGLINISIYFYITLLTIFFVSLLLTVKYYTKDLCDDCII